MQLAHVFHGYDLYVILAFTVLGIWLLGLQLYIDCSQFLGATVWEAVLSDRCPVCPVCPVCDVGVLWSNGCMDQDAIWYEGRPRLRPHCVTWGPIP